MKVSALSGDPFTNLPVVILKDEKGHIVLPVGIGVAEAAAIAAELDGIQLDRPLTHDLMSDVLGKVGVKVERVSIYDVVGTTFYASLHLSLPGGGVMVQDARASDAIALALRNGSKIQVARRVLEKTMRSGLRGAPAGPPPELLRAAAPFGEEGDYLDALSDEAFGKWKM